MPEPKEGRKAPAFSLPASNGKKRARSHARTPRLTRVGRAEGNDPFRAAMRVARGHPRADQRTIDGHSVGYWDGDVLIVETTNFADHRSPYQMGVPSGAQKRVVERYRLLEGGKRMIVEFTLEDPEYIVGSMVHSRELVYSPQMSMTRFDCNPDVTRRFVPE